MPSCSRQISYLEGLLASPHQQRYVIREDLMELRERYADPRRTAFCPTDGSFNEEDLIARKRMSWSRSLSAAMSSACPGRSIAPSGVAGGVCWV